MSKNHTIRGCKGLEKNEKQGTFFTQTTQLLHLFVIQLERTLGTKLLTYEVGGAGGTWGGGVTPKKRLKRRWPSQKKRREGGVTRNILVHVELT